MPRLKALPLLLLLLTACRPAADGVSVAYVAVGGGNHVRVIDLDRGTELRRVYAGAAPWRLDLSPDGARLFVQHWYAGTTAVVDLQDHRIVGALPFRGPGTFLADGTWLTADWPARRLAAVDPRTLEVRERRDTGIQEVYDLAAFGDAGRLLIAQHDPMARGPAPHYGYVLSYRWSGETAGTAPLSHPVGADPLRVVPVPGQPFFLAAAAGTDGIHLINELGDVRALKVCPAPREIALAPDGGRLAVLCWRGRGARTSRVVLYDADFTARPWPRLERRGELQVHGGLVAADFAADGRLVAVDRSGGRLLVLSTEPLTVRAELPAGPEPTDVVVARRPRRLLTAAAAPSPERRRLREALAAVAARGAGFRDLTWTETATWPLPDSGEDGTEERLAHRRTTLSLRPPDALRSELEGGGLRLAADGHAVALDAAGRFWVTPRQDLLAAVLTLPAADPEGDPDAALRRLAGDVDGAPFLSNGIAVDRVREVAERGVRYLVVGADSDGEPVSQLWIDLDAALPVQLVEAFPVFGDADPHAGGTPPRVTETHLEDWRATPSGALLPRRLRRIVEGSWQQEVMVREVAADRDLPAERFDLRRLGGVEPAAGELFATPAAVAGAPPGPGRAVPVLRLAEPVGSPLAPQPPYPSNPPTSGAWLPWSPDAGVHRLPVPLPLQVHHLLDGGTALLYDCPRGCAALQAALTAVAARRDRVLVAPYPWLPEGSRLAVAAWGRLSLASDFDPEAVERFLDAWGGGDHHEELAGR